MSAPCFCFLERATQNEAASYVMILVSGAKARKAVLEWRDACQYRFAPLQRLELGAGVDWHGGRGDGSTRFAQLVIATGGRSKRLTSTEPIRSRLLQKLSERSTLFVDGVGEMVIEPRIAELTSSLATWASATV
ncbi:hypothetical protein PWT90_08998 [Aphanocladium album]|nr:hypothetical protein PWT90_08998 [Aphanocladium album]